MRDSFELHLNCFKEENAARTILFPTLLAKKHWSVPQTVILGRGTVIHIHFS